MLDQAKQDGDDVAGVAHAGMHTHTAMDYLDSTPARFLRGTACTTIVPGISVVAEKHYAWALAIAAGIATNRNGYPWGYLNSVNDVFKSPHADRDETMRLAHPETGTRRVHVHGHPRGEPLPRPRPSARHDRRDAEPGRLAPLLGRLHVDVQLDGRPDDVLPHELDYSILDQENIARGHTAYYLTLDDEALESAGEAYYAKGTKLVADLPALARKLRQRAIDQSLKAEALFEAVRVRERDVRRPERLARRGGVSRRRVRPRAGLDRGREGHAQGRGGGLRVREGEVVRALENEPWGETE